MYNRWNRTWVFLVLTGLFVLFMIVAWDLWLTFAGWKSDFQYVDLPVSPVLLGPTEQHLLNDLDLISTL